MAILEYDKIEEHLGLNQRSWVLLVSRNKGGTPVKEVTLDKRERYARTNQNVGGKLQELLRQQVCVARVYFS